MRRDKGLKDNLGRKPGQDGQDEQDGQDGQDAGMEDQELTKGAGEKMPFIFIRISNLVW